VAQRLSQVQHVILVLSGKGGVGKSSVSSQLAWRLSHLGFTVGLLDIDICGPSVPRMTGVESAEVQRTAEGWAPVWADDRLCVMSIAFMLSSRNDAVIWRGPRKNGLIKQFLTDVNWDQLHFLIIDAPPGTSDEHLSIITYLNGIKITGAIVVTTPQEMALLDVRKEINFCKKTKMPILGVVENMAGFVCPCCKTKSDIFPAVTGGAAGMCNEMSVPLLGSVPIDPNFLRSCEDGVDFVKTYPTSIAVSHFNAFVDSVLHATPELQATKKTLETINASPQDSDE